MMKPPVVILSDNDADRRAIVDAALSQGCRSLIAGSVPEVSLHLKKETSCLLFCDAALANGGGTFSSLATVCGRSGIHIILIVAADIKSGLLKALKPWVHDYLSTPVLREAAAARIKNAVRMKNLEQAAGKVVSNLQDWLSQLETVVNCFDPLAFDAARSQGDLARRLVRMIPNDRDKPAYLMIAVPDGCMGLDCDLYAAGDGGAEKIVEHIKIPESAVFLRIKADSGLSYMNYFDRGGRLADLQASFPPVFLEAVGTIHNLAGFVYADSYVVAFNYGRPVTAEDALFLKGLALPGTFLGAVAGEVRDVSESFLVMTRALALATDSHRDNGAHVQRMNEYARTIAERMMLPDQFVQTISYSAQLHDVGKIYIHPDLLEKPLRLTPHEFELVKRHSALGARILGDAPMLRVARNIALTHHECWDGSGYPAGLAGNAIPLEGAIIKVADVYDALRTMHTYKSSYSHDDACRLILDGGGDECHEIRPSHFHPDAIRAFRETAGKFEEIYHRTGP
jgi:response regulator RpfG family c-di-GMP phosphodiesterase